MSRRFLLLPVGLAVLVVGTAIILAPLVAADDGNASAPSPSADSNRVTPARSPTTHVQTRPPSAVSGERGSSGRRDSAPKQPRQPPVSIVPVRPMNNQYVVPGPSLAGEDGSVVSQAVTSSATAPGGRAVSCNCLGDVNGDGFRDFADISQFVSCLLNPGPGCECADINLDLNTDGNDIQGFVGLILAGSPCQQILNFATSAQIALNMINPPLGIIPLNLNSAASDNTAVILDAEPYNTGIPIATELVKMEMTGFDPGLGNVVLSESPALPSNGFIDNVVASPTGGFVSGDSSFGVFVVIDLPDLGLSAFNQVPVQVQALGISQLPPAIPHVSGPTNVPLVFSDPQFQGEIVDVVHNPEPVCIYEVTCIDGPCNDCGVSLGDICTGARCPGGTCSVTVQTDCGMATCCVIWSLVACDISAEPPCPFGQNFCPICNPMPGACCLPDGSCIVTTEADCKQQGGPMAYQGDGTVCAPPERCCFPDGSCTQAEPTCCTLAGGTPDGVGACAPVQACCLPDGTCVQAEPSCCTSVLGGTPDGVRACLPVEACCLPDGTCVDADPTCCTNVLGGTPDGPGLCLPLQKCCLPDDSCVDADPGCCINVLGGTPFPGLCAPIEACCFPDGTCTQLEPDCCMNAGGIPDGVGPCMPIEACCLPNGTCIQAEPSCCINIFGGIPDGVGPCMPIEACCLPNGTCIQAEPSCCINIFGGTPDGVGPCLPLEACCFPDNSCQDAEPFCCLNILGGEPQGVGTNCAPNPCCVIQSVVFEAINSPIDANPNAGGGRRVFVGDTSPTDPLVRNVVRVKAQVMPAIAGKIVFFRPFDVDDPSSGAAPVDKNDGGGASGDDNRGRFAGGNFFIPGTPQETDQGGYDGNLGADDGGFLVFSGEGAVLSATTDAAGMASVELLVTFAPGDNFRCVVGCNQAEVTNLGDDAVPSGNAADLAGFSGKVSPMLTVWRKLHTELDSMAAPNAVAPAEILFGTVTDTNASGSTALTATVLTDGSETWQPVGQLIGSEIDPDTGDAQAEAFEATGSTATTVTVAAGPLTGNAAVGDPYSIDTDDNNPGGVSPLPDTTLFVDYRRAYIEPLADLGALDATATIAFVRNLLDANAAAAGNAGRDVTSAPRFWVVHMMGSYDPQLNEDFDPDALPATYGFAPGTDGPCHVYNESIRDRKAFPGPNPGQVVPTEAVFKQRTGYHESMHRFNMLHGTAPGDEGPLSVGNNLFGNAASNLMTNAQLNVVRLVIEPD